MSTFNSNITLSAVYEQKEQTIYKKKENKFDEKNYLQARLGENETSKTLVIRLLPFEPNSQTPFHKVWMHTIKVNKEISKSGWKSFPCPTKNELGDKCPFCNVSQAARDTAKTIQDEALKKKANEIEYSNRAKESWVVRVIDRQHMEDGVKFWLFSHSKKGDGVYNKIMNKVQNRAEAARLQGKENNILDLNTGRDLIITLTKTSDGKTAVDVDVADDSTPLTTDYELGLSWINDPKKWTDVFTVKPYDYMKIIAEGGIPMYSKEKGTYVDKTQVEEENKTEINTSTNNTEDIPFSKVTSVAEDLPF